MGVGVWVWVCRRIVVSGEWWRVDWDVVLLHVRVFVAVCFVTVTC